MAMETAVAIMAAGRSERFGGCKLLADVGGGTVMLERTIQLAVTLQPESLFVVTGAWHQQLLQAQVMGTVSDVPLVEHLAWQQGLGRSIAFAVAQLPKTTQKLLILLADQVALQSGDLQALRASALGRESACAFYHGRQGVPALFDRSHFPALSALTGEQGARSLLRGEYHRFNTVAMPRAALDIDTQATLAAFCGNRSDER